MEIDLNAYRKKVAMEMGALKEQLLVVEIARDNLIIENERLTKLNEAANNAIADKKPRPVPHEPEPEKPIVK